MTELPFVSEYSEDRLNAILHNFPSIKQIATEKREDFSGDFPRHTRYFSNGDRPLVALVKLGGYARLVCDDRVFDIDNNNFVLFDDGVSHGWNFKQADLEIYYYRFADESRPLKQGDYCLDNYF